MMEQLQRGVLQLCAASFLVALLQQLMPEGSIKRIGKFLGGLILLLVLLKPLLNLRLPDWEDELAVWQAQIEAECNSYRSQQNNQWQQLIEENTAAYIQDKAAEMGITCTVTVQVQTNEEGIPCPVSAVISGRKEPQLAQLISQQLGIGEECQIWLSD